MTKTYTWTTPRGAAIETTITVNHITRETVISDGWPVEVKCDRWVRNVESITVNGQPTDLKELYNERGAQSILIKRIGQDRLLIALPADVESDLYGEERIATAKKAAASAAVDATYEAHCAMMRKAMAE